jgi:hypothetical protein
MKLKYILFCILFSCQHTPDDSVPTIESAIKSSDSAVSSEKEILKELKEEEIIITTPKSREEREYEKENEKEVQV